MKQDKWIKELDQETFDLPINIKYDNEYFGTIQNKFDELIQVFQQNSAPNYIIEITKTYTNEILSAINLYYRGNIIQAHTKIFDLIEDCCNDNPFAISHINDSIAFLYGVNPLNTEVQFFRARLNDNVVDYPAKEMLHIPFSQRSIVNTERFSIPGLPSLYLVNTSYVCWLEMGRPADHRFNVSPVILDNTQTIFNLAINLQNFFDVLDAAIPILEKEQKLCGLMKLYLLNFATSVNVKEQKRNFKSEYIISQMIMLACKNKGLNGITYHSKKVSHDSYAKVLGINLVLFAEYNGERNYSKICDHIKNGTSFNYSMFKQLLPSLNYRDYRLRIDNYPHIPYIGSFTRQFPYDETLFYKFDKYLFAFWDKNLPRGDEE